MSNQYNQAAFNNIIDDLKAFLDKMAASDKLLYLENKLAELDNENTVSIEYRCESIDLISQVENIAIDHLPIAEKKQINFQLHLSLVPVMIYADRIFLQQILYKLLADLLDAVPDGSVISVHVTDIDGKCVLEAINRSRIADEQMPDDYFKKYRITNFMQIPASPTEDSLPVYQRITEDMGGELIYNLTKKSKRNYFRLKFGLL